MNLINNHLFKKQLQKYRKKHSSERRFITYDRAKSVCLLFETPTMSLPAEFVKLIKEIKTDGKKVTAWGYTPIKKIDEYDHVDYHFFSSNEVDFFGRPKANFFKNLYEQKFDILIDLSVNNNLPLAYLSINIPADFKIGVKKTNYSIYDFMLDIENMPKDEKNDNSIGHYVLKEIIYYLKNIDSKD